MPQPLIVALPPNLNLWGGCVVRVAALDPSTGNVVSGVTVSTVTLEVDNLAGTDLESGPFMLVTGPQG